MLLIYSNRKKSTNVIKSKAERYENENSAPTWSVGIKSAGALCGRVWKVGKHENAKYDGTHHHRRIMIKKRRDEKMS